MQRPSPIGLQRESPMFPGLSWKPTEGFEPSTPALRERCSGQLSYVGGTGSESSGGLRPGGGGGVFGLRALIPDVPRSRFAGLPSSRVAPNAVVLEAASVRSRLLGLALLNEDEFPRGTGLLIRPCASIHTFGMRFAIDIAFADDHGRVVRVIHDLPPRRFRTCRGSAAALETHAGELSRFLRRPIPPGG